MQNYTSINIVIGSWGSYNACNSRALGSKWIDLSDYTDWEEIETVLKQQGFKLDGIDEELFVQDIEGLPSNACNWDYTNPQTLFETLRDSGVLDNVYKHDVMQAYLEVRNFEDFENLVKSHGFNWDDDIRFMKGYSWEDYGREALENNGYEIPEHIQDFINFEDYGRYMGDCVEECNDGLIEIYR